MGITKWGLYTSLGKLLQKAKDINLPYITYYENLVTTYGTPENCEKELRLYYMRTAKEKINNAYENDIDSKLGAYLQVNPNLVTPSLLMISLK